jgi:amidophosphoribosyltransferase
VRLKLNPVREVLQGKRVVVVDDSIVRGTTSRKIVKMLRDAGAREVHLRISSPPTRWPCFYGIDTPNRRELIAASHSSKRSPLHHLRLARVPVPGGPARAVG